MAAPRASSRTSTRDKVPAAAPAPAHHTAGDGGSGELRVFIASRDTRCEECGDDLGRNAWIALAGDSGALCLTCADLDHLVFLARGDAALTRRARKYSTLAAVVLRWSRSRKQYERQGLLVEDEALQRAEAECLNDEAVRSRRRERDAERRASQDAVFVAAFATRISELFPACPAERPERIAEHACERSSQRVGRTVAARRLDEAAVVAHIRHTETRYDALLARGVERVDARAQVRADVDDVLARWRQAPVSRSTRSRDVL